MGSIVSLRFLVALIDLITKQNEIDANQRYQSFKIDNWE